MEYLECQADLENAIPECPACECKSSGAIWFIMVGLFLGLIIQEFFINYKEKKRLQKIAEQTKLKLKKLENKK